MYLQDSWTIAGRFTVNAGLRAEQEYVPAYTDDPAYENAKPIDFKFKDKLAPRLGFVYDVLGDSSLKVFGSYGIYYDVFKLYVAGASFGGSKSKLASYTLDTYEWDKIGVNGYFPGTLLEVYDYLPVTLDNIDPALKPLSQREFSFGAEKKIMENFSATVRLVQKNLHNALEDSVSSSRTAPISTAISTPASGIRCPRRRAARSTPSTRHCPDQKGVLGGQLQPGQEVRPELAGRVLLHLEPAHRELPRPGHFGRSLKLVNRRGTGQPEL